ncbi:MAG: efflux RND transporter periplasmic adaptor subunit [Candidatus Eisenbacteria bacterium]
MKPMRKPLSLSLPLPLLLAVLALPMALSFGCSKKEAGKKGAAFAMPPTPVEIAVAGSRSVADVFEAVGTIEARNAITVVSEIDGVVREIPFREGDPIRKGMLIARIDDDQLAAEVARTEALRDQSRSNYERVKAVVEQGAGASQDLDDAAAALKVAEANLSYAQARLKKARITAPFDGVIGSRRVSPGAFVRAGDALTDLAQLDHIRVHFAVPERYLGKLSKGAAVAISTTAYPGEHLDGTIEVIDPVLDPDTRSAQIVADAENLGGRFRPGMSANVQAVLSQRANALTIPNEAVFVEGSQAFVFVIQADSTVTRAPLQLGTRQADVVEVLQGLEPGARVVRAGHQKLYDGAKVMPVVSQPAQASDAGSNTGAAGGAGGDGGGTAGTASGDEDAAADGKGVVMEAASR